MLGGILVTVTFWTQWCFGHSGQNPACQYWLSGESTHVNPWQCQCDSCQCILLPWVNHRSDYDQQSAFELHPLLRMFNKVSIFKNLFRAGFKPATLCVWGTRDNRYTNETWWLLVLFSSSFTLRYSWPNGSKKHAPPGGLEPPTFRLTAERASQLRHGGWQCHDVI